MNGTDVSLFQACDNKHYPGCYNAALMHQSGKGVKQKDILKASKLLDQGCEGGDRQCCFALSNYYITGKGNIFKDMNKAFTLAKRACDLGHMYACANLSQMYKRGEGTTQDDTLAAQYRKRAEDIHQSMTTQQTEIKFGQT